MFASKAFHAAALIAGVASLAAAGGADLDTIDDEVASLAAAGGADLDAIDDELDLYPEFRRGLLRYRHHEHRRHRRHHHHGLRHRHPPVPFFRRHRAHQMALAHAAPADVDLARAPALAGPAPEQGPGDGAVAAPEALAEPMALPGRHPSVEKALGGMSGDLRVLKERELAAKHARGELEGKISEVVQHMNDATSIKHAIAQEQTALRVDNYKHEALEREGRHLDQTHSSLMNSLHRVLEPKLMFAAARFEKKERVFEKEAKVADGWKEKKDQVHMNALRIIKEKKAAHQSLLEAEAELAQAKKREELADQRYRHEMQRTGQEVQSYRYAETRYRAELTREEAAKRAAEAAEHSVQKLQKVFQVESEKVEESIGASKQRVQRRLHELEVTRGRSAQELEELRHRYSEWQASQRQRAAEVVKQSQDTAAASEAFAAGQQQVLDSAQRKVAHDAESKSDWASDSDFGKDAGVPEESLSD